MKGRGEGELMREWVRKLDGLRCVTSYSSERTSDNGSRRVL